MDHICFLHRLSTWGRNAPTFGIVLIWRTRRTGSWCRRGTYSTWGGIYPRQSRSNVTRCAPCPVQILASFCGSGGNVCFSWVADLVTAPRTEAHLSESQERQASARLDPEVPHRNDPASDMMGKIIRYQVTEANEMFSKNI